MHVGVSNVGHVTKKTPFDPWSQIGRFHLVDALHSPPHQFWNLCEAGLARFAIHNHYDEVINTTVTLEADRQTGAGCRCDAGLDPSEGTRWVLLPEQEICVLPLVLVAAIDARRHIILLSVNYLS